MTKFCITMDSKEEMFGTVKDPENQSVVNNMFYFLFDGGSRKFTRNSSKTTEEPAEERSNGLGHPFCSHSTSSSSCLSLPALEVSSFSFLSCILHLSASVTSLSKVNLFPLPTQGGLCATHPPPFHLSWVTQSL